MPRVLRVHACAGADPRVVWCRHADGVRLAVERLDEATTLADLKQDALVAQPMLRRWSNSVVVKLNGVLFISNGLQDISAIGAITSWLQA